MTHRSHSGPRGAAPRAKPKPVAAAGGAAAGLLALQQSAGNRAVVLVARRVVGNDPKTQVLRFEVGVELSPKLATNAWSLTEKGPLNEQGVGVLRRIALEHPYHTIDVEERLFIAALLDPVNAAKLHAERPSGFSESGQSIEFSAASVTPSFRRIVQDQARSEQPAPDDFANTFGKDALDRQMIALGIPGWSGQVRQIIKMADESGIDHLKLYFAMLNGASDSTPGDRTLAGIAYVMALREGLPVADQILRGKLNIDEASPLMIERGNPDAHAFYSPSGRGSLKGDTVYLSTLFDIENPADLGALVHELQHASDDFAAGGTRVTKDRVETELTAYTRQSRFLLNELARRWGEERTSAIGKIAPRMARVVMHLMIAQAVSRPYAEWPDNRAILRALNAAMDAGAAFSAEGLEKSMGASRDYNEKAALAWLRHDIRRAKQPKVVEFEGLIGDTPLDRPAPPAPTLAREPAKEMERKILIDSIEYMADNVNVAGGVTSDLIAAAQARLKKGAITSVGDLDGLRKKALADQTVSDAERMFLAGLLDPVNAERIKKIDLKDKSKGSFELRFALDDVTTKRIREVGDIGRPAAGEGAATDQIVKLGGGSKGAWALLKFARERKVSLDAVVEAMRLAGSDSTPADMVGAGSVYAIAAAAGNRMADDVRQGRVKVDVMPISAAGSYSPTGSGGLRKGDTVYLSPKFDLTSIFDRDTVIHELQHALQDKGETAPVRKSKKELEPDAWVAGSRYLLEEIARLAPKDRSAAAKKVAAKTGLAGLLAAAVAARADPPRLRPILKLINDAIPKGRAKIGDYEMDNDEEPNLRERLVIELGAKDSNFLDLSGLAGESLLDFRRQQPPPAP